MALICLILGAIAILPVAVGVADLLWYLASDTRVSWQPFVEELGGTWDGRSGRLELEGQDVRLRLLRQQRGEMPTVMEFTVASVAMPAHPGRIEARTWTPFSRGLATGDDAFDDVFRVDGPPAFEAWLSSNVRRTVERYGHVTLQDGQLTVRVEGYLSDLDQLHDMLHDAARLASELAWDPSREAAKWAHRVRDPVAAVRERSLRMLIEHHPERVSAVADLSDPDATVRTLAASWLDAPEVLIDVLVDGSCSDTTRDAALTRLATSSALHHDMTPRLTRGLLTLARSPHRETQRVALECLGRSGDAEVEQELAQLVSEAGWLTGRRRSAQAALARLRQREGSRRGSLALASTGGGVAIPTDGR